MIAFGLIPSRRLGAAWASKRPTEDRHLFLRLLSVEAHRQDAYGAPVVLRSRRGSARRQDKIGKAEKAEA